jgi:hypothetical protein
MTMPRRLLPLLALAVMGAMLAVAAPAQANFRVGMADQFGSMYDNPLFQKLKVKRVRYLVPIDWYKHKGQNAEVVGYMARARLAKADLLVHFTARRGCYDNGRYSKRKVCRAPSVKAYTSAFKRFRKAYPWVRTYGVWNEANHPSQPTVRNPRLAARYFLALRKNCGGCSIVALDVLDTKNMQSYVASFRRNAQNKARIYGLHNYGDVNRRRSTGTRQLLAVAPGEVWLTETGGILKFGSDYPRNATRQAKATKYMFKLAAQYDSRQRGLRGRITRLYNYQWTGAPRSARFDAGLVNVDGTARKAYNVFKRQAKKFSR